MPSSRSRMSAAPVKMMVSMVRLLIICITELNQLDLRFGLNLATVTSLMGIAINPSRPVMNSVT